MENPLTLKITQNHYSPSLILMTPTQSTTNSNKPKTDSIMEVLSTDMTGQLDIFQHDWDMFCMDGEQVGVLPRG